MMVSFDEGGWGFERVVGMERVDAAIPPVVARIFSGDSTSPLTREARMLVCGEEWCGCESVSAHTDVSIVKSEGIVRFWKGGVRQSGECGFERVVGMVGSWNGGQVGMAMDLQKNGRCC